MIKLFRNIRKKLFAEGKTTDYLKYAIGEIVLVVIGILIALQVNNWNENRIQRQKTLNIYEIVAEDMKNDITRITKILDFKNERKPIFDKILNGEMTKDDYLNCKKCIKLISGYNDFKIEQRGFDLLNNYTFGSEADKDTLQIRIKKFYMHFETVLSGDNITRAKDLENNIFYWESNFDWYADFALNRDYSGFIQYALNSKDYRNRVANFYLLQYLIYIPILESYKKDASELIKDIQKRLTNDKTL